MVGVEKPLELDLSQQDAVVGLTRRGARGVQIAAAQGVEGGGVAQSVGGAQGCRVAAAVLVGVRGAGQGA